MIARFPWLANPNNVYPGFPATQPPATIPFEDRLVLREAGQRIVQLYESWGKPDKATEWREQLQMK